MVEWVHVSDLVAGRSVDLDFVPRVLAYVEAKAAYEALSKVLQLLYEAKKAGLVDDKLVNIIADWLSEVEAEYRFTSWEIDGWYKAAYDTLRKVVEKQAEQHLGEATGT